MAKKKTTKKKVTRKQVVRKKVAKKKTSGKIKQSPKKVVKNSKGISALILSTRHKEAAEWRSAMDENTEWRLALRDTRFTDEQKKAFCEAYAIHGVQHKAATIAEIGCTCVRDHLKIDKDFAVLFEEAKLAFQSKVQEVVNLVAFEGVNEPIIGGRFKDQVVAHKKVYATNILAMEMRRTNAEHKENSGTTININTGVLAIPMSSSREDWENRYSKAKPIEGEVVSE